MTQMDDTARQNIGVAPEKEPFDWIPFYGPVAMTLFLIGWEVIVRVTGVPALFLPAPSDILIDLVKMFRDSNLFYDLVITLYRIFTGFFIAAFFGIGLGLLMGMSRRINAVADIFVSAAYPIPKVALVPLLIIWLGSGNQFQIALAVMGCFIPIVINTVLGVRQCDEGLVLAARDLGASRRQIMFKVVLPGAIPSIFSGLRLALGVSIILIIAAEMLTARYGLGARLQQSGQIMETGEVFAVLLLLAIVGVVLTKIQQMLEPLVSRWQN